MKNGLFITFEGGEGSGKTTLITKLSDHLKKQGHNIYLTREPGGTKLSEKIRSLLLDTASVICPTSELLLFLASRAQNISENIHPALGEGKIVLCDRFNDSTIVYQGTARNLGTSYVKKMCDLVTESTQPNITFFLDVPPEIGLKRASSKPDRIESEATSFHKLVRKGYQSLAEQEPERIYTIDATQPADVVFQKAVKIIETKLSNRV